jgi:iron complex outermembrane receptor protein
MGRYAFRVAELVRHTTVLVALPVLLVALPRTATAQSVSEKDFLGDLPVVLSVSRLAQPLNEVPGSVTVIDRDLIRRSGAREVAEVLRLVPGFLFTSRNGANPQASYHSGMDVYGARMQVYVDGRSLYSSFFLGDTNIGLRGVVLEDIERIEVLRGSNSASYGANAFLGVVNIVTRNAADTHGAMVSATLGDKGINDNVARVGWGDGKASFRLTGSRRVDRGFNKAYDDSHVSRVQFRGDLLPSPSDEVMIQLGAGETSRGDGLGTAGNPFRTIGQSDVSMLLRWQRQLASDEKLELRASYEREAYSSEVMVSGLGMTALSASGGSVARAELGLQHSRTFGREWRLAWGGEWRHESLRSPPLYATDDDISLHDWRAFATLEWRPHEQWVLQASGMQEGHSYTGSTFSPRLAANFHVTPDHTLRAGVTKSQRAPNFYELRADTRLYNQKTGVLLLGVFPVPVGTQAPVVGWPYLSSGTVRAESLISHEIGYLGHVRQANLRIDARAFVERMNDRIVTVSRSIQNPAYPLLSYSSLDFVNRPGPHLHGFEYQFDWRPLPDTRLMLSEMHIRSKVGSDPSEAREAPFRSNSLTWLQKLPGGFDFSAISTASTPFKWPGGELINTPRRLDVRLGRPFAVGATRGELSVTVQAINGGSQIYKIDQRFDRRAFATLRLDF